MTDVESLIHESFARLYPAPPLAPDWSDVLRRNGQHRLPESYRQPLVSKRRILLPLVVFAAVLAPLAALGAANDWWFLGTPPASKPTSSPTLIKQGTWAGKSWQLVAYTAATDGLCWAIVPGQSTTRPPSYSQGCGPFVGVPRTNATKESPDMSITYLSASSSAMLPAFIAGPVIDTATEVEIRFRDGETVRTPTFAAPPPLEHVRFFAIPRPRSTMAGPPGPDRAPRWLAGLDASGNVVACLAPLTATNGVSPPSACG